MNHKIYEKIREKFVLLTDREISAEYQKIIKKLDMTPESVNVNKINDYLDSLSEKKKKK